MPLSLVSSFPERLKEALQGKTSSDFAKEINVSKQTISAYTTGARKPKIPMIKTIANALDVNEAWLLGYDTLKSRAHFGDLAEWDLLAFLSAIDQDESLRNSTINVLMSDIKSDLLYLFEKLNDEGQKKLMNYACDLIAIDKYKCKKQKPTSLKEE